MHTNDDAGKKTVEARSISFDRTERVKEKKRGEKKSHVRIPSGYPILQRLPDRHEQDLRNAIRPSVPLARIRPLRGKSPRLYPVI
ncbi:hypothetical protein TNCT_200711 [Trichonephila clavata]|uniref:Uncharacterized protein n=1 Tax=Trichonephila clavata TaxID=2740835 RepID=A0A8X6J8T3_TRICU|nr:hypothetical protein TNCT_200711 [Trichonephila clavata]